MNFFQHVTVRTRLIAAFGLLLAILTGVALISMSKVSQINTALQANSERDVPIQRYAINFRGSAHDRSIAVRDVVLSGSTADRQKEIAAIDKLAAFYAESAKPLETLLASPDAAPQLGALYQGIKDIETRTVATTQAILKAVDQGDAATAQKLLWTEAKPQYEAWLAAINKLIDFQEARIQAANKLALEEAGAFKSVMLSALAVALLIGGGLAWLIPRSITRQLGAEPSLLSETSRRVADGDLNPLAGTESAPTGSVMATLAQMQATLRERKARDDIELAEREAQHAAAAKVTQVIGEVVDGATRGDFARRVEARGMTGFHAELCTKFNQLLETVSGTMRDVRVAADQLTAASNQVSATSQSLSQGASQQAASVEETAASLQEIAVSVRKNADSATLTDGIATKAASEALEGGRAVSQTAEAMKAIATKISIVDDIAYQTNLLALNAAIEAARAGEHGKGFAVVAAEVRKLAERSQVAAQEIGSLASSSVRLAEEAGALLSQIVPGIRRTSELVQEIASASGEQSDGVGQINSAMNHLSATTQQAASASEQMSATADDLAGQAQRLQEVVAFFKLDHAGSTAAPSRTASVGVAGRGSMAATAQGAGRAATAMAPARATAARPMSTPVLDDIDEDAFSRF